MTLIYSKHLPTYALLTALLLPATLWAQAPASNPPEMKGGKAQEQGPRREPPPQAYDKCKGKKEGDKVQINTPREGSIGAVCIQSPKGLFARPDRPPHDQQPDRDAPPAPPKK